jgi:hypothetical protein
MRSTTCLGYLPPHTSAGSEQNGGFLPVDRRPLHHLKINFMGREPRCEPSGSNVGGCGSSEQLPPNLSPVRTSPSKLIQGIKGSSTPSYICSISRLPLIYHLTANHVHYSFFSCNQHFKMDGVDFFLFFSFKFLHSKQAYHPSSLIFPPILLS